MAKKTLWKRKMGEATLFYNNYIVIGLNCKVTIIYIIGRKELEQLRVVNPSIN